ncbi:hypothetical protein ACVWZ8_003793 [Arthrobacter sp. UYCu723]
MAATARWMAPAGSREGLDGWRSAMCFEEMVVLAL